MRVLAINPGSTSTKVGVFDEDEQIAVETIRHDAAELATLGPVSAQAGVRLEVVLDTLDKAGIPLASLDGVVGRGGVVHPLPGGTYAVEPELMDDLQSGKYGEHASNLGGILALAVAAKAGGLPAFVVDPPVVDELDPLARYSGHPRIQRQCVFHALNQKAVARRAAAERSRAYDEVNLIVAHMGGGITVGAHRRGRVIDVNNGLDGDGPFAPERAGGLPTWSWVKYLLDEKVDPKAAKKMVTGGGGGVVSLLGTSDMREVESRADAGDAHAQLIRDALTYQVAKEIGGCAAVLHGDVDAIVITGGLAYDKGMVAMIRDRVSWIADVVVYPGEDELAALAQGALRVLHGTEEARHYADAL